MNDDFKTIRINSAAQDEILVKMLHEVERNDQKVTSFKMWDTLVITPFSCPEDLFLLMEDDFAMLTTTNKSFSEMRIAAQKAAEKKYGQKGSVTLEKIYDILTKMCSLTPAGRTKLINRECDLLHHYSFPRKIGKMLFNKAKDCKKDVIITSVSYYPRDVIVKILCDCGYGSYSSLIIPYEQNIPDSSQTAFLDIIIKKSKVEPNNILHIGGDYFIDVEAPIVKGMRSLMLQPIIPLMVKSGRLRGYIEEKHLYDLDEKKFFPLRCALALYAVYGFDVPQTKKPHSDFCDDDYMLGFIVLGPLTFINDFSGITDNQLALIRAMESNKKILDGKSDFTDMVYHCFGDFLRKYGGEGCQLPLEFLELHSYLGDRNKILPFLSDSEKKNWGKPESEPKLAPVHAKTIKKNALQKLADKLFPEGTRVREMSEDVLHRKKRKK